MTNYPRFLIITSDGGEIFVHGNENELEDKIGACKELNLDVDIVYELVPKIRHARFHPVYNTG